MCKSLPLLLGLAACHAGMHDTSSMHEHLDDMRHETERHLDASLAAASMLDIRLELSRHDDSMIAMMTEFDLAMDDMASHCSSSGLSEMNAMHAELHAEWTRHLTAMDGSVDLGIATTEAKRHASTQLANVQRMHTSMRSMACR